MLQSFDPIEGLRYRPLYNALPGYLATHHTHQIMEMDSEIFEWSFVEF